MAAKVGTSTKHHCNFASFLRDLADLELSFELTYEIRPELRALVLLLHSLVSVRRFACDSMPEALLSPVDVDIVLQWSEMQKMLDDLSETEEDSSSSSGCDDCW